MASATLKSVNQTERISPGHVLSGLVSVDAERMSGTPCFAGTRVPLQHLWDYLEGGDTLADFLDAFEGVSETQAKKVLRVALEQLLDGLPQP